MIHIIRPRRTRYSVHPLQMREYIEFDRRIRESAVHMHRTFVMPLGYLQIAEIHNAIPARRYPYRMVTYNTTTHSFNIPRYPARSNMVSTAFLDPRYRELGNAGLIAPSGELDNLGMQDINAALRRPHGETVKKSKFFHRRQAERQAEEQIPEYSYEDEDDFISDGAYSPEPYSRTPSPNPTIGPMTPPIFPDITPPMTPTHGPFNLPSYTPSATVSPQQLINRRASSPRQAVAGPGPSTIAHRQSRNNQQISNRRDMTPMADDSSMDEFLNIDDENTMDDEDNRDEFLKDFEGL
ncbi:hypothetical protein H0H92_012097 [Tricholoma furcatifolium]|nr:hypothetical protein H0H92_012097 [Tricholoma furcatifolium]